VYLHFLYLTPLKILGYISLWLAHMPRHAYKHMLFVHTKFCRQHTKPTNQPHAVTTMSISMPHLLLEKTAYHMHATCMSHILLTTQLWVKVLNMTANRTANFPQALKSWSYSLPGLQYMISSNLHSKSWINWAHPIIIGLSNLLLIECFIMDTTNYRTSQSL